MDIIRFQHLLILPTFLKGKIATTFQPTGDRIVISTILQPTWYLEDIWFSNCLTKVQTVPGPKFLLQEALEGMPELHRKRKWCCSCMFRRIKRDWVQPGLSESSPCLHTTPIHLTHSIYQVTSVHNTSLVFVLFDGLLPMLHPAKGVQWSNVNSDYSKFFGLGFQFSSTVTELSSHVLLLRKPFASSSTACKPCGSWSHSERDKFLVTNALDDLDTFGINLKDCRGYNASHKTSANYGV